MKPAPFEYHCPDSLDEVLALLEQHGYDAKLLAGGQSLVPMMNFRLAQPAMLVDLNRLPQLDSIVQDSSGGVKIGAMVRQSRLEQDPLVAQYAPLLHECVPNIAHPQIRNRGTVGGNLAHADPASELPAVMVALQAKFRLRQSGGDRWIGAGQFFQGLFATDCAPEEMLVEIAIPPQSPRTGWAFEEVARRHGDYALAGVAALASVDQTGVCTGATLVYLSAGEVPMSAPAAAGMLAGQSASDALFEAAAEAASANEIEPVDDIHATAEYKRHLVRVLTKRALKRAFEKAEG